MANFFPSSFPTTSAELAKFVTDETGTGALVFATSPTLVTPTLGAASATSLILTSPLAPAQGGSGISSYAVGDLIYASASATLSKLADVATGSVLRSGGVNTAPAWGPVNLTTDIINTLAVANGGTGTTTFTANTILTGSGTSAIGSIALGTANQLLGMNSGATASEYKTLSGTTNQITVTHAANSITLSSPQNLNTSAAPQFARQGLGAAADATNILGVLQASTAANSKGIDISHTGAITGTGYAGYFSKTGASTTNVGLYATASGATNSYSAIFDSGNVGIGTVTPPAKFSVNGTTQLGNGAWPTISLGSPSGQRIGMFSDVENGYIFLADMESGVGADRGGNIYLGARGTIGTADFARAIIIGARENATSGDFSTYLQFKTSGSAEGANDVMRLTSTGNVGIGTTTPNANALLDIVSTTKAFMPPRMTTTQRNAISSPTAGMMVYNSTNNVFDFYNGTIWGPV